MAGIALAGSAEAGQAYGGLGASRGAFLAQHVHDLTPYALKLVGAEYVIDATKSKGLVTAFHVVTVAGDFGDRERLTLLAGINLPEDARETHFNSNTCLVWSSATLRRLIGERYAVSTTRTGSNIAYMHASSTPGCSGSGTTTSPATGTPEATTPKSGPLSAEPKITVPSTPAPTRLETKDLIAGTGATARAGDTVVVNYVGALYTNGKVFDSSWSRGQTFTAPLVSADLIQGWVDGIPGMKVGGRRELIIPPALAYKNRANGTIPANSTLIFIVDLLKVTSAE
jgi:hypothetical protein